MAKARVAVLISGTGTNMAALLYAAKAWTALMRLCWSPATIPDAAGLKLAEAEGIATFAHPHKGLSRGRMTTSCTRPGRAKADYVALAGYMRILVPRICRTMGRPDAQHPPQPAPQI
jgi:phosphoribosylglycinamide formyltransferase-1